MQPEQPTPPQTQLQPQGEAPIQPSKKSHKKLALWLLIGPTAFIILALAIAIIMNLYFSGVTLLPEDSFLRKIINIIIFLVGAAWFPGVIIGIILLAKK